MKQVWTHTNELGLSTLTQGFVTTGPLIGQGLTSENRIGNDINLYGLQLKGALYNNSAGESFMRCVVVGYPATNGDPTLNLFRNAANGNVAAISSVNGLDSMYFPINKLQLKVYHDKVYKLAGNQAGNAGANTFMFNKFIKFGGKKIQYIGNQSGSGKQNWLYSTIWIPSDASDDTTTGTTIELSQLEIVYFKDA